MTAPVPGEQQAPVQAGEVPPILAHLADWEDKNGTLCAITPDEWMALMEPIANLAVLESPRMAVNRLRSMQAAAPAAGASDLHAAIPEGWTEREATYVAECLEGKWGDGMQIGSTDAGARFIRAILARHAASSLVAQQAAAQPTEDQRDAERYRFLRDRMIACDFDWQESGTQVVIFEMPAGFAFSADCDATIDAAMRSGSLAPTQERRKG